jgi:very-short-patch-repair endonuclease
VVDFLVPEAKLVTEVDGPIHALQGERDRIHQELLEEVGLTFLRFSIAAVETRLADVLLSIDACVKKQTP